MKTKILFDQTIFTNMQHLLQDNINITKARIRSTCEKYFRNSVAYKYRHIGNELPSSNNETG